MWVPSKDPDDYLLGQPGHPRAASRAGVPARVRLPVYIGATALAVLVMHTFGAAWNAAFPISLLVGSLAQVAVIVWWRRHKAGEI